MNNITTFISRLQITIGIGCLIVFLVSTLIQVGSRHFGISVIWSEELAVNSFIWAMFLGAAVMVKEKEHFSFSGLTAKLEGKKRSLLIILQNIIMLVFCVLCSIYSIEITETFWNSRWISLPELKQGYVWLVLPITFMTSAIYLVENIVKESVVLIGRGTLLWN
ncbi:TRAP transporter small permease [Vibrio sp. ZSDZ34]|uniref:TRAP transporter small permease protein n=1 Tax=Vibrio gelatinilyticus TaxID=2893468 RepID=A0A9X1W8P6_9VIBR|nr:TRAP transporter small permease [Vibrio gelatinilyticus]MCJ2375531.1 TRAP transporter small permease [Vibrio gelatinilyticus]